MKNEFENKYNNKCAAFDVLQKKYKTFESERGKAMENVKLQQNEYEKSIKFLERTVKNMELNTEEIKEKEVRYESTISELHKAMKKKDKLITEQKKKIKKFEKELELSEFGDNKKFSQMSLLKKNVGNMQTIIRDKDNQIKTLTNKLNS
eukprot:344126_1